MKEWTGTGFAIKGEYIITNHHVVNGAQSLQVRGVRGDFTKMYNAVIVAKDESHDMAIIRIEDSRFTGFGEIPYSIKPSLSEVGEDIFILGYPLLSTMGEEVKLTTGIISSRSGFQGEVSSYQVSAPIQPGNSGGPLFDTNGDVVGIVNAKHRQADNASYAIKSPYLHLFVQNGVGDDAIPTNRKLLGLSLTDKVKAIKQFVFIIYASTNTSTGAYVTPQSPPQPVGATYKIGDVVRINGVEGIVFEVADGGRHGKAVSVMQSYKWYSWSADDDEQKRLIGADNEYNGAYNMAKVQQVADWRYKYPAFAWCADLGEGWYLPAKAELVAIYRNKEIINKILFSRNGGHLANFLSSTECGSQRWRDGEFYAWHVRMDNGEICDNPKFSINNVRAVFAF